LLWCKIVGCVVCGWGVACCPPRVAPVPPPPPPPPLYPWVRAEGTTFYLRVYSLYGGVALGRTRDTRARLLLASSVLVSDDCSRVYLTVHRCTYSISKIITSQKYTDSNIPYIYINILYLRDK